MSHFAVLVIGPDVEKQLQPYHEFECTGDNDEFVQDVDRTAELLIDMAGDEPMTLAETLDYYGLTDLVIGDESEADKADEHKFGYAVVKDGQLIKAVRRTNPNKKWEKARAALNAAGAPLTWKTWEHIRDVEHKGNSEAARNAYHDQPSVKSIKEAFKYHFFLDADQFLIPHSVYTQQARDQATVLYAFVKDGQWVGKGEMGWFGMSLGDEGQSEWNRKFNEMLDALPDDTQITVVDCHI